MRRIVTVVLFALLALVLTPVGNASADTAEATSCAMLDPNHILSQQSVQRITGFEEKTDIPVQVQSKALYSNEMADDSYRECWQANKPTFIVIVADGSSLTTMCYSGSNRNSDVCDLVNAKADAKDWTVDEFVDYLGQHIEKESPPSFGRKALALTIIAVTIAAFIAFFVRNPSSHQPQ
jgi:hypothetical protein